MTAGRKVALLIETSNAYARGLMQGIVAYLREHRPWSIYLAEHSRGDRPPGWLAEWQGDGVIARVENRAIARLLSRLRIPVVDVSAALLLPDAPYVETDDAAIVKLAMEHLLERGFRHFGFCGDARFNWSNWREEQFRLQLRAAGYECSVFRPPTRRTNHVDHEPEQIGEWLDSLPKPVGIMACYDFRGQQVLDAARQRGIFVPDDVAVIGVDNDELIANLAAPPMSSVIPNAPRIGYEAAVLLDRMMKGEPVRSGPHLVAPQGVATRQSTDTLAIEDRNIVKALRYIREHACEGIRVRDVLRAVPQSRRIMESRFKRLVGRTPQAEITRMQLNRVKTLLAETDLSLDEIAARTGFAHTEYLSVVFKRVEGKPPSAFRAASQTRRGRADNHVLPAR